MEIRTKFSIEDEVWAISYSKPKLLSIKSVRVEKSANGKTKIYYGLHDNKYEDKGDKNPTSLFWQPEKHIALTKKELLESFLEENNN